MSFSVLLASTPKFSFYSGMQACVMWRIASAQKDCKPVQLKEMLRSSCWRPMNASAPHAVNKTDTLCPWNRYDDLCLNSPEKRAFVREGWLGKRGGMQSLVQKMPSKTKSSADNSEVSIA